MPTTYTDAATPAHTAHHRAMIFHALTWLPFGSGDEYIFPEFGVTPAVFYHKIVLLITAGHANFVDSHTREELRDFCGRKIARLRDESRIASLTG